VIRIALLAAIGLIALTPAHAQSPCRNAAQQLGYATGNPYLARALGWVIDGFLGPRREEPDANRWGA
jgi:hypothetical protein